MIALLMRRRSSAIRHCL